jgi:iron complex outermembrane receptor protein
MYPGGPLRHWRVLFVVFLAHAGVGTSPAWASESDAAAPEAAYFADLPVVLSVTRLTQPQSEVPASVTILDREMIRASGVRNIADLFRYVPGFQVSYNHGSQPVVAYHGLSDEYARTLQVLVDGRALYDVFIGGVYWQNLPVAIGDIERIEVIRGPNSAAYGSKAYLGVINIITQHSSQAHGTTLGVAAGDRDIRDGFAREGWAWDGGDARVTLDYRRDDGLQNLPDDVEAAIATFRSDLRLSSVDTLEAQLGINVNTNGIGHDDEIANPPHDREWTNRFGLLRWRRALGAGEEISLHASWHYWDQDEDYQTQPVDLSPLGLGVVQVPVSLDAYERRYDLEFQHVLNPSDSLDLVWTAGVQRDQATSLTYFGMEDTIENRSYRLSGHAAWRAYANGVVNVGAMVEKDSLTGTDVAPRLALNHHVTSNNTLRVAASRGFHNPSIIEERANARFFYQGVLLDETIVARGGLKAETVDSYELGWLYQVLRPAPLTVDLRLYEDRIRDRITELNIPSTAPASPSVLDYRNEGALEVYGADLSVDYRFREKTRLLLGYSRMHIEARDFTSEANFSADEHERSAPSYSGSAAVIHNFGRGWDANLFYSRVSDYDWLGGGHFSPVQDRVDLRLARSLDFGQTTGEIAIVFQNLEGGHIEFETGVEFGRRTFLTAAFRFP